MIDEQVKIGFLQKTEWQNKKLQPPDAEKFKGKWRAWKFAAVIKTFSQRPERSEEVLLGCDAGGTFNTPKRVSMGVRSHHY